MPDLERDKNQAVSDVLRTLPVIRKCLYDLGAALARIFKMFAEKRKDLPEVGLTGTQANDLQKRDLENTMSGGQSSMSTVSKGNALKVQKLTGRKLEEIYSEMNKPKLAPPPQSGRKLSR